MVLQTISYRLRGGQIQPRSARCDGSGQLDGFYAQTFGAEKITTDVYDAKTELLASTDFQGQKPTTSSLGIEEQSYIDSTFTRASYQGKPLRTTDGTLVFSATEEHCVEFIDESELGIA